MFTDSHAIDTLHHQVTTFRSSPRPPLTAVSSLSKRGVGTTEVVLYGHNRNDCPRFLPAKNKKLEGQTEKGTLSVVVASPPRVCVW